MCKQAPNIKKLTKECVESLKSATLKITLDKSENERTYYKTIFNKKEGWVESKYLAERVLR